MVHTRYHLKEEGMIEKTTFSTYICTPLIFLSFLWEGGLGKTWKVKLFEKNREQVSVFIAMF